MVAPPQQADKFGYELRLFDEAGFAYRGPLLSAAVRQEHFWSQVSLSCGLHMMILLISFRAITFTFPTSRFSEAFSKQQSESFTVGKTVLRPYKLYSLTEYFVTQFSLCRLKSSHAYLLFIKVQCDRGRPEDKLITMIASARWFFRISIRHRSCGDRLVAALIEWRHCSRCGPPPGTVAPV